jgi:hypothetical protein
VNSSEWDDDVVRQPSTSATGDTALSNLNVRSFRFWFDEARYESRQEVLDEALPDLVENRAAIEQAKGVMMAVYRLSPDQAFRVLQWRSQETNVKLRTLAKRLIHEVSSMAPMSAAVQSQFDGLLLTVDERIPLETGC